MLFPVNTHTQTWSMFFAIMWYKLKRQVRVISLRRRSIKSVSPLSPRPLLFSLPFPHTLLLSVCFLNEWIHILNHRGTLFYFLTLWLTLISKVETKRGSELPNKKQQVHRYLFNLYSNPHSEWGLNLNWVVRNLFNLELFIYCLLEKYLQKRFRWMFLITREKQLFTEQGFNKLQLEGTHAYLRQGLAKPF